MPSRLKSHVILVLDRLQCVARVNCLVQVNCPSSVVGPTNVPLTDCLCHILVLAPLLSHFHHRKRYFVWPHSTSFSFFSNLFMPIATALSAIGHSTFSPAHPSSPHIPFVPLYFTECISCSSRSVIHQLPCHRTYCRTCATGALKPSVVYSNPSDFSPDFCTLFRVPQ